MRVLVDTNVLSDVLHGDPVWGAWSSEQLDRYAGGLCINPVVYAELGYRAESEGELEQLVADLSLHYLEIPKSGLFLAAKAFRAHRERGGTRMAPLPDFFIGGHAQAANLPLLTRDAGRYPICFPTVRLITRDRAKP